MKQLALSLLFAWSLQCEAVVACSFCKSGDQWFFLNNARMLTRGQFLFAMEYYNRRQTFVLEDHDDGGSLLKPVSPFQVKHGGEHDTLGSQHIAQASLGYALSDGIMLMVTAPYIFNRIPGAEETQGLGDPEILARASLLKLAGGKIGWQAFAGMRLPLGQSDKKDTTGELLDHRLQPGSGARSKIFGLQMGYRHKRLLFFLSASYQANARNKNGIKEGNLWRFNAAMQYAFDASMDLIAEINGLQAEFDKNNNKSDPNSGGTGVYFSPGIRLRYSSAFSLRGQAQIPVAKNFHGERREKISFHVGVVWEF